MSRRGGGLALPHPKSSAQQAIGSRCGIGGGACPLMGSGGGRPRDIRQGSRAGVERGEREAAGADDSAAVELGAGVSTWAAQLQALRVIRGDQRRLDTNSPKRVKRGGPPSLLIADRALEQGDSVHQRQDIAAAHVGGDGRVQRVWCYM